MRRAVFLAFLATLLLAWASLTVLTVLYVAHVVRAITARLCPAVVPLVFTPHEEGIIANASLTFSTNDASKLRVRLRFTLPESDHNHAHSVSAARVCAGNTCTSSTLALAYRSPTHRAARAVLLAIPLLLGIADEYQSVELSVILPSSNNVRIILEAPLQVAAASATIRRTYPPFTASLTRGTAVAVLALWYTALACLLLALRVGGHLRQVILRRIWRQDEETKSKYASPTSSTSAPMKTQGTPSMSTFTASPVSSSQVSANRPPPYGGTCTTLRNEGSPDSSISTLRRRRNNKIDDKIPACLLNGQYGE